MNIRKLEISNQAKIDVDTVNAWDNYVEKHPEGKLYHLSAWATLIKETFGHENYYFYSSTPDQKIDGLIPLIRLKSRLFGDYFVSQPYFNYGGAIGDSTDIENNLISHTCDIAKQLNTSHIEFRDSKERQNDYPVKTDKVNMILELPENEEVLWKDLGSKRRAQIKRPLRENPTIHIGHKELLSDFYQVFAENMRDLGTPVYSKYFFNQILKRFSDNAALIVIRINNEPVGAGFLIGYKGTLEIPWASTLRKTNNISINMLMYWEILKYAIQQNYAYFDFGRSSVDSGTYRFKKQWGAQPQQLYWHYWLREGEALPALNPNNPKYKLAINTWKKLPISLTKIIGPNIVKNLP